MDERTKPTNGTASAAATTPLKRIPNFMKRPRRESVFSSGIGGLLVLSGVRSGICMGSGLCALGGEPGDDVGDFLVGNGFAWNICAPVGSAEFGAAGDDDRAQALIADEREKGGIGDGTTFRSSVASRAVAGFAIGFVGERALGRIAGGFCRVRRRIR